MLQLLSQLWQDLWSMNIILVILWMVIGALVVFIPWRIRGGREEEEKKPIMAGGGGGGVSTSVPEDVARLLKEKEDEIAEREAMITDLRSSISEMAEKIADLREALEMATGEERGATRAPVPDDRLEKMEREIGQLRGELTRRDKEIKDRDTIISDLKFSLSMQDTGGPSPAQAEALKELQGEIESLRKELEKKEMEIKEKNSIISDLKFALSMEGAGQEGLEETPPKRKSEGGEREDNTLANDVLADIFKEEEDKDI